MLKCKRFLSTLLAACLIFGLLPITSLAVDTSALHNCEVPEGYHLFTDLPTAENPTSTETLYYGAAFDGVLYGMNSNASSNSYTSTSDTAAMFPFTILYGGTNETYGSYYYLTYNNGGTQYAIARSGAYYSQNKLTDGLPSNGWAAKHKFYYDAEQMIFYNFSVETDLTSWKGMKMSASTKKLFVESLANLSTENSGFNAARFYVPCTSDNVAGTTDTHQWSGSCIYEGCATKFDYKERVNIADPNGYHQFDTSKLPTVVGETVDGLYLGTAFEANGTFYGLNAASTQPSGSSRYYTTSTVTAAQCTISVRYAGNDATYGDYYNLIFTLANGTSYVIAYASGFFSQNLLTDGLPSGGFAAKHNLYFDEDYQFFYNVLETDTETVMKGLKISASSYNIFTESVENLKVVSADFSPVRLFEACTSDNVAGTDDINVWSGACACGYLFDYQVKPTPDSYHISTNLPTADNTEVTGLSFGGNVNGTFYGLNAPSVTAEDGNRYFTTATAAAEQCIITVRYAGNDEIYGDYYNVIFRIPGGDSYAIAYAGGYFTQNKIQDDGLPSGGWAAKHNLFYDAEGQFFYFVIETADEIVKKGLKLSTASQNIFTEKVENLKTESDAYVPVRLYEPCVSNEIAGKDASDRYSGTCNCGYKFDVTAIEALALPGGHHAFTKLPTAENPETEETLHMGIGLLTEGTAVFYGMSGSFTAEHAASTSADAAAQYTFRVLYGGNDETYGDYYYVIYNNLDGTEYALAYASGYVSQNKILETGEPTDGWAAKHKLFYDAQLQTFYFRAPADMSVMKGIKISTSSYNLFTEKVENLKGDNEIYAIRPYAVCSSDNVPGSNDTHHWSGTCQTCGYLFDYEENYVVEARAPQVGTPYYWGVTQMDAEGQPTYFFNGAKLTSNFNTKLDMLTSTPVYVDVVEDGYKLYFLNENSEKQYICMGKDADNSYATYVAIETDVANATVFTWNESYNTFVTTVVKDAEGNTVDMVLGAYTSGTTAYTKLNPLTLASLAGAHYFPSQLYVEHMTHEPSGNWSWDAENHWKACFCGKQSEVAAHNFSAWAMDLSEGIMRRSCDCGYVQEVESSVDMPAFREASVSLHTDFALNFYVKTDAFVTGDYKNPYVVFEMLGEETTVTQYASKNDSYVFIFDNLAPDLMNETVTATLYATAADGSEFVLSTQYSVAQYCYTVLRAEDTGAELKKLMVEALNFGAAAQAYRGSESTLVNADLTAEEKALGSTGALRDLTNVRDFGKNDGSVCWYGASLLMSDSVKIRMYFQAESISGLTLVAGDVTYTEADFGTKDGKYYVDVAYENVSEKISFTVYNGETAVSTTATYSVESYAATFIGRSYVSAEQIALVEALIRYADAAKAYAALDRRTVAEQITLAEGVTKYAIQYDVFGVTTNAYAVVVDADSSAKVMTVAAPWDETNNDENPVELYNAFEYKKQLKDQGYNVLAITNGGFFHMSAGSNLPWGMQIVNGEVLQAPSKDSLAYSDNWFGVTNDGAYVISNTDGYNSTYAGNIAYGIGGGKLLMVDGVAQSVTGQDSYRTCVGLTADGDLIIMCLETCTYEMAIRAFEDMNMGVTTVLNMDGGGSTTLYTTDSIWTSSYDICGDGWWPRDIADAIAIVAG